MPTLDILISTGLESIASGIVLGIALTVAVAIAIKVLGPLNAATRAVVWLVALAALPLIPVVYFAGHIKLERPVAIPISSIAAIASSPTQPSRIEMQPVATPMVSSVPATETTTWNIDLPSDFAVGLLGIYAAVVFFLLGRLFVSYVRLRLLRRRTQPAPAELTARLEQWLARCSTARPVQLRLSSRARSPLAIGFWRPYIVMPADLVLELNQAEYDDLGVHELAHLRRYDDWTNLFQRFLQAFLFFHPAAYYIGRKLNLEREFACDDWVVSSHESKSYAQCLAKVVELRRYHRGALLLSSGAFFGKRQIVKRVEALLDKTRNSATTVSTLTVVLIVTALIVVASQVVHLPHVVAFTQDDSGTTSMRFSDDSRDLRINTSGEISFSPDEQSVSSISPSGFMTIDESKGWSHRRLEVRPDAAGHPVEKYFLDGREKPLDGVGRAWAASTYLFVLRETGIDAEARVTRILQRSGPTGVLQEVGFIHSDHVKAEYLTQLLEQAKLTVAELQRVSDNVCKISSDNDKAEFLIAHEPELLIPSVQQSYFRAVNSISSDNDHRRVLTHLLETNGHDKEIVRLVGLSAKQISSDNDKAEVLLAASVAATGDTGCALLSAAQNINSDNDKARVLRDTAYIESAQCRDAYFAVVNLINSDNDRSDVLQKLIAHGKLDAETYRDIANSTKGINSDNDKANVLVVESAHYTEAPFFEAANTIQSSNDRARVLKKVLEQAPPAATLLNVVMSASTVSGDNEKADILVAIAKQSNEPEVQAALQKACKGISSDNDYRRVAGAIFENSGKLQNP